jgi:hypothetical protein
MATPDIRNLFERFLQIYGGQSDSTEPTRSEPRYQSSQPAYSASIAAYGGDDGYAPSGGVLRGWSSPPAATPWWARPLAGPSGMPVGLRGPTLGGRIRGYPFPPMPLNPDDTVQMPDPHVERLIPQWMRDFWNAQSVVRQVAIDRLDSRNQASESPAPSPKPEDASGGLGWYVGPPQLEDELKRVTPPGDVRIVRRVDDDAAKESEVESPPLAPTDAGDTANDAGCDEEWAEARRACEKDFQGPPGQSPSSKPRGTRGRNYTIEDCMRGLVSERCGGNPVRYGSTGAERAKRNNNAVRKKRGR